jgi:hypothetical protein
MPDEFLSVYLGKHRTEPAQAGVGPEGLPRRERQDLAEYLDLKENARPTW